MTKNAPSMNALAKRINHPKWTTLEPVLDILEKGVSHPQWPRTKIHDEAGETILSRLVELPAAQDLPTLDRVNVVVGKLLQKRSFARLGLPARGISVLLDKEHEMKKKGQPWMTSTVENTKNGAFVAAFLAPGAFENWLSEGHMKPATEHRIALNYLRQLSKLPAFKQEEERTTTYTRMGILHMLERMAGRGQDRPDVWFRLARKFDFNLDKLGSFEKQTKQSYPKLRSGLTRALLHGKAPTRQDQKSSSPKM